MIFAIPLAWLQLFREKMRLLVAVAGIGFAVILMFMQLGFKEALFKSAVTFHELLNAEIVLISPESTALISMSSFPQNRLSQALNYEGVTSVSPLYLNFRIWKNPETEIDNQGRKVRNTRSILVAGIDPEDDVFNLPELKKVQSEQLTVLDQVLFDRRSRPEFGRIEELFTQAQKGGKPVITEVGGHQVRVGGLFTMGASFGADGNMITSESTFLNIAGNSATRGQIEVGLIKLKPEAKVETVLQELRGPNPTKPPGNAIQQFLERFSEPPAYSCRDFQRLGDRPPGVLPEDVCVLSKREFIEFEKRYWQESTAIGFIFTLGTAMGFVVGTIIVYQILYTDVTDHLPEYATLKAMGYTNWYLTSLVFQEALILSFLGYLPGFLVANVLYGKTEQATNLPLQMDISRILLVLSLTILMCVASGTIAVRKAQSADPADIF